MVQKWNVAMQQELPGAMALELAYQGNHSVTPTFTAGLQCVSELRQPRIRASTATHCGQFRIIGGISGTATFGYGNYHALTAKLEKRMTNGLQFITSYTYGHALANSGTTLSGSNGFGIPKTTGTIASWYTSASWDIRHNFTTGFTYEMPFGRGKQSARA